MIPRVFFNALVCSKDVFLQSSSRIETHFDVVVDIPEVKSSVPIELFFDEEFIEICLSDIMF